MILFAIVFLCKGHLFFGNIESTIERVLELESAGGAPNAASAYQAEADSGSSSKGGCMATFIVLDFSYVTGADINAGGSLVKLRRTVSRRLAFYFDFIPLDFLTE